MTLTRSQRKKLDKKEEFKANRNTVESKVIDLPKKTTVAKLDHESAEKPVGELNNEPVDSVQDHEESDQESSESDTDSSSDSSESEEEEDLDLLLQKAQDALSQQNSLMLEEKKERKLTGNHLKMNDGLKQALYLKTSNGRAKLTGVELDGDSTFTVQANNTLTHKPSRKERQEERVKTSGKDWFDMPRPEMTPELKRDLQVLKMRHVLDRKRHYKKMGKENPTYFQVGTVVEGPTEFFSARMTRKERKTTIVDELLASEEQKQYYKRKHAEVTSRGRRGGKGDYKKLKAQRKMRF